MPLGKRAGLETEPKPEPEQWVVFIFMEKHPYNTAHGNHMQTQPVPKLVAMALGAMIEGIFSRAGTRFADEYRGLKLSKVITVI